MAAVVISLYHIAALSSSAVHSSRLSNKVNRNL
jgi:hypothetical protein